MIFPTARSSAALSAGLPIETRKDFGSAGWPRMSRTMKPAAMLLRMKRSASWQSISRKFASLGHTRSTSGEASSPARRLSRSREQGLDALLRGAEFLRRQRPERGLDGGLRQRIGRYDFARQLNQLRSAQQRANARAGERMRLRQGAQDRQGLKSIQPARAGSRNATIRHRPRPRPPRALPSSAVQIASMAPSSKEFAVGLLGEHRYTNLTCGCQSFEQFIGIQRPAASREQRQFEHLRALDAGAQLIHAESRHQLQDGVWFGAR